MNELFIKYENQKYVAFIKINDDKDLCKYNLFLPNVMKSSI